MGRRRTALGPGFGPCWPDVTAPQGQKSARTAKSYSSAKTPIFTYRMTIFAPATRRGLFVDWAFFDGSEISSEFVGGQCASWRFPPKAAVSACSRHSFVEGIRNGGLDVTQNRRSTWKIHFGRTKLPALQRFFSFPVLRGRIACLIWFRFVPVRLPLSAVKSSHR